MSYHLLKGKTGLIFGPLNENSIAWQVAEQVYQEGGNFVISNTKVAVERGDVGTLAQQCGNAPVIAADATKTQDLKQLYKEYSTHFDGIDFILHSIGMSPNVRKDREYTDLNYEWFHKTLDISALSLHRIITGALPLLNENASIVALTYIGAQRIFSSYGDMSDAKALLETIARNYGAHLGEKGVRVNTVSQSPTPTTAGGGIKGFDTMYEFADRLAPLGNASAKECAEYVITLFSDLTRKVTLQNLYHDGGFSSMGMSEELFNGIRESM
ncbi:MAG: enoyl-ACP reductase [candidate division KSB1 bacterium]|nr:enoyl-ACP reductase [candidate division KSB1 bacterium]